MIPGPTPPINKAPIDCPVVTPYVIIAILGGMNKPRQPAYAATAEANPAP